MKVLIDTNILISAALFPNSTPYKAFVKAVTYPNHGIICEQNLDELRRIFNRKFPNKISALESFLSIALTTISVVPIPEIKSENEVLIRDTMDRPILRAAQNANVDILMTGDKDFLESGVKHPKIVNAADFLSM